MATASARSLPRRSTRDVSEIQESERARAVPREMLVDRVVDDLEYEVVEPGAVIGVADVHAGSLAHTFEALQDADRAVVVRYRSR